MATSKGSDAGGDDARGDRPDTGAQRVGPPLGERPVATAARAHFVLSGTSAPMCELYNCIDRVAPTDLTVLIIGESGTGKEAVARAIHAGSPRADQPFIAVNCGAIAPTLIETELLGHEKGSFTGAERRRVGYFERANGGTLLLDEITEMPPEMQVKFLRVLESRRFHRVGGTEQVAVDVRILAATNRSLESAAGAGAFRKDLLYRLAVFPVRVPALRERGDDIAVLAQHFLDELNREAGTQKVFSRPCLREMRMRPWQGNVRELRNTINRAFILSDRVLELPPVPAVRSSLRPPRGSDPLKLPVGTSLADAQRAMIMATLDQCSGDKRKAARALGISLKTLYNRLEAYRGKAAEEFASG